MEKQEENGVVKYPVLFTFDSYPSAIFGYMIFESIQLRPYFVKENTTYKKKLKNKSADNQMNYYDNDISITKY